MNTNTVEGCAVSGCTAPVAWVVLTVTEWSGTEVELCEAHHTAHAAVLALHGTDSTARRIPHQQNGTAA